MLLAFKLLNNQATKYLYKLISIKKPTRLLRSNTSVVLLQRKANTVIYGQRSIHHHNVAPKLWNQFLSHVKTPTHSINLRTCSRHTFSANDFVLDCICIKLVYIFIIVCSFAHHTIKMVLIIFINLQSKHNLRTDLSYLRPLLVACMILKGIHDLLTLQSHHRTDSAW